MSRNATFEDFARFAPARRAGPPPTLAELRSVRDRIVEIVGRYHGSNVRVFGSVARGDAQPDSDIDFLVDVPAGVSLFDLGGMHYDLGELLGLDVDVVYFHAETRPEFRSSVEREVVAL